MKEMNCCLTLACHRSMEERLVGHLLEHPEWVRGFVMHKAEGGSQKEILPSMIEQVRGRSQRVHFPVRHESGRCPRTGCPSQAARKQSRNGLLDHPRHRVRETGMKRMSPVRLRSRCPCFVLPVPAPQKSNYPDLPPHAQVDAALSGHINVLNAETGGQDRAGQPAQMGKRQL